MTTAKLPLCPVEGRPTRRRTASLRRAYGKLIDKLGDGKFWVEFSAEADCEVTGKGYRIVDIRVGKFGD